MRARLFIAYLWAECLIRTAKYISDIAEYIIFILIRFAPAFATSMWNDILSQFMQRTTIGSIVHDRWRGYVEEEEGIELIRASTILGADLTDKFRLYTTAFGYDINLVDLAIYFGRNHIDITYKKDDTMKTLRIDLERQKAIRWEYHSTAPVETACRGSVQLS